MRFRGGLHLRRFRHHLFVEGGAARGVEQHDVVAAELRGLQGALRDLHRLLSRNDGQRFDGEIAAEHGELFLRGRTIDVERRHQNFFLVALGQAAREFCSGGGFARALQADHHDRDRGRGIEIDLLAVGAECCNKLVVDDLHDHLAGGHRLDDGGANRLFADLVDKGPHHVERDVGLEHRAAHLAHGGIDVGFRQRTAPRQPIENASKLFRQIVEHRRTVSRCSGPEGDVKFQTRLRPRAHSAVGRWPPASGAGRRVEKNVFPRSAGVKPLKARKVKKRPKKADFGACCGLSLGNLSLTHTGHFGPIEAYDHLPPPLFWSARRRGRRRRAAIHLDFPHENLCRPGVRSF